MTQRFFRALPVVAAVTALALAAPFVAPLVTDRFDSATAPAARSGQNPFTAATAEAAIPARAGIPTLAPLIEKVTPAVVNVSVKGKAEREGDSGNPFFDNPDLRRFFDAPGSPFRGQPSPQPRQRQRQSSGSGVIVDAKKGYVLTNHHVIDNAAEITVTLKDRRELTAKVIGSDDGTDIALLQIAAENLSELPLGEISDLRVGDYVVAIGNPFGLSQTVTSGIVSALGRSGLNIEGYEDFIQTDASINPGNSGGALVNLKGELIGINTAIIGPTGGNVGIGFAVPVSMAKSVMTQLVATGSVSRGRIGLQIRDMSPELAKNLDIDQSSGALIASVEPGTPADAAGLKAGDVVTAVDGAPIQGSSELRNRVGLSPVGTNLELTVRRGDETRKFKVSVGKTPSTQEAVLEEAKPAVKGATFADPAPGARDKGVVVTDVEQGSAAWEAGLRPQDIVVAVNRKSVSSVEELRKELKESERQTALFLKRDGQDMLVVVQ